MFLLRELDFRNTCLCIFIRTFAPLQSENRRFPKQNPQKYSNLTAQRADCVKKLRFALSGEILGRTGRKDFGGGGVGQIALSPLL